MLSMKENLQEPNSHASVGHAGCVRKLLNTFSVVPLSLDFGVLDVPLCFFSGIVLCSAAVTTLLLENKY